MSTTIEMRVATEYACSPLDQVGVQESEFGPIPQDWTVQALDDLDPFVTSGSRGWARYYSESGNPFVRITNISRDSIYLDLSDLKFVELPDGLAEATRTELRDGDILISITADIGIISYVDERLEKPAYINQHLAVVRVDPSQADSRFLSYFWASERPQQLFRGLTDQGAKAGMSLENLRSLKFAAPNAIEQRAISATLSDLDKLIVALDKLIAKKRAIKLTFQNELLTGIRRLPGFSDEWIPFCLGDLARPRQERVDPRTTSGTFCVDLEMIEQETGELLDGAGRESGISLKCVFQAGDILFGKLRAYLRKYWLADRTGMCSTEMWVLVPVKDRITSEFLFHLVQSDSFIEAASQSYGTHMPRSDWKIVSNLEYAVPGQEEQQAITAVLSDLHAEIGGLECRRDKVRAMKRGAMQQLLTGRIRLMQPETVA